MTPDELKALEEKARDEGILRGKAWASSILAEMATRILMGLFEDIGSSRLQSMKDTVALSHAGATLIAASRIRAETLGGEGTHLSCAMADLEDQLRKVGYNVKITIVEEIKDVRKNLAGSP